MSTFKEAGMGRRLGAIFIDSYCSYLVAAALEPRHQSLRLLLQLSILFIEISLLTSLQGASFGQMVTRLKVIDSRDGQALSIPRILARTAMIVLVLPAIFRNNGRAVHDIVTNSTVVKIYKNPN
jgi:uncharacterized RDD family membrane protein YckC